MVSKKNDLVKNPSDEPANPNRRRFLQATGVAGLTGAGATLLPSLARAAGAGGTYPAARNQTLGPNTKIDYRLAIDASPIELAPDRIVGTLAYNGQVPGPLLRVKEDQRINVLAENKLDRPDIVHFHGLFNSVAMDGAPQEGSPLIPPGGDYLYSFIARPAGMRWYHPHMRAGADLGLSTYTGQHGVIYIEPKHEPGNYDKEVFLVLHEWQPYFTLEVSGEEEEKEAGGQSAPFKGAAPPGNGKPNGYELGYQWYSINGKMLGFGEPVRVHQGQRVLFHILNASSNEAYKLSLPGHRFKVIALDGNPVANPQAVETLKLATAERVSAIVAMDHPGVWIFGSPEDEQRKNGMGIVVEYANKHGQPQWQPPKNTHWDYTDFGKNQTQNRPDNVRPIDDTITLRFDKINRGQGNFNLWPVNHMLFNKENPRIPIHAGKRYRLILKNYTSDPHPLHLHRHTFQLRKINGRPTAGVFKDVVQIEPYSVIEAEFPADNPYPSGSVLFHCHQQLHMDYGFQILLEYQGGVYRQGKA
jgi:FtsP/CotA-like multicopper oxidase with cupredoxin domain